MLSSCDWGECRWKFCGSFLETFKRFQVCAFGSSSPVLLLGNVDMTIFDHEDKGRNLEMAEWWAGGSVGPWRVHGPESLTLALDCKLMDLDVREEYTSILFKSLGFFLLTEEPDPTEIFPIAPKLTPGPTANNKRSSRQLLTFRARSYSLFPPAC